MTESQPKKTNPNEPNFYHRIYKSILAPPTRHLVYYRFNSLFGDKIKWLIKSQDADSSAILP